MSFKIRNQLVPDIHDSLTILAGNTSVTKTHNNKVFANCRLRILGWRDDNDGSGGFPYITLTQSGANVVVTATRLNANTSNILVTYAIEEYVNHVIRSVQRGVLSSLSAIPVTATVTQTGAYWSLEQLGVSTTDNVSGNMGNWCMTVVYDGVTSVTATPSADPSANFINTSWELTDWY